MTSTYLVVTISRTSFCGFSLAVTVLIPRHSLLALVEMCIAMLIEKFIAHPFHCDLLIQDGPNLSPRRWSESAPPGLAREA